MTASLLIRPPAHPFATRIATKTRFFTTFVTRVLMLLLLTGLFACSKDVDLQTGLKDADANEMVTVLSRHGIESQKRTTKEGVALSVKENDIARATEALNAAGLPRRSLSNLGQVFKKEGMISTPLEERVRYIAGLSAELEYTLQQFDHVVEARVHVVLPERVAPGEPIQPSSAAVFIKYAPPMDEDTVVPRVRNLVASSIPGLSGEEGRSKVSVVLMPSEAAASSTEWTTVGPFRVTTESATGLLNLLVGLTLTLAAALFAIFVLILWNHPKTSRWMKQRFGKKPTFQAPAGDTAGAKKGKPAPAAG